MVKFAFEVDVFFDEEFDEVAIEKELVGLVELVVNSEEIYDPVDLLIIHSQYRNTLSTIIKQRSKPSYQVEVIGFEFNIFVISYF